MRIDLWDTSDEAKSPVQRGVSVVLDEKEATFLAVELLAQLCGLVLVQPNHFARPGHLISTDGRMLTLDLIPRAAHTQPGSDLEETGEEE